ncbi:hypothetical protein INT45_011226 [Circinella minor]|uniref:F-box domain-containing protein n=1 Tax=Circinella minor TaxID=1195481 RepID=A0A8H7S624_9FUNG|nr:hypothetical protein INT45_011226 [Circinella minor]
MLKQAYNNLLSTFQFSQEGGPFKRQQQSQQEREREMTIRVHEKAQKTIRDIPNSAKGYLELGRLYRQDKKLLKALNVYKQGLQVVSAVDPQYTQLQKEKNQVSATLTQRSRGFHQFLPYDVLIQIFSSLDFRDMLRCTGVCQQWCNFMMEWPEFWQKMSREMPQVNRSTLDPLLRRQAQEFRLEGPLDQGLVHDMLLFLSYSDNHFMEKLCFSKLDLTDTEADLLAEAIRSTSALSPSGNYLDPPKKKEIIIPNVEYTSLTYLKLSFHYIQSYTRPHGTPIANGRLGGILHQCPNLVHLFMDSGGTINHKHLITQVIKQCHNLETLVVAPRAELPTILNGRVDTNEFDDDTTMSTNNHSSNVGAPSSSRSVPLSIRNNINSKKKPLGIRRLVLSGKNLKLDDNLMVSIYKKYYKSLELIYLHYDGRHICTSSFYRLAYHGAPRLRDIYLSTESDANWNSDKHPPVSKALAALFTACPALEIIDIDNCYGEVSTYYNERSRGTFLIVNNEVLKEISNNCPQLRKMRFKGARSHTREGLIQFASTDWKYLTDLEMNIEWQHVLEVVNKLTVLKNLDIRDDTSLNHQSTFPENHRETANRILEERGGRLNITRT